MTTHQLETEIKCLIEKTYDVCYTGKVEVEHNNGLWTVKLQFTYPLGITFGYGGDDILAFIEKEIKERNLSKYVKFYKFKKYIAENEEGRPD